MNSPQRPGQLPCFPQPRKNPVETAGWIGLLAATTLILAASYTLWMIKRVYFGPVGNDHVAALKDIGAREFFMLTVLVGAVLWMGVYPKFFTDPMQASVQHLLQFAASSKLQ